MSDRREDPVYREEGQSAVTAPGQQQNPQQVPIVIDHDAETEIIGDGADVANLEDLSDEDEVIFVEEVVNRPRGPRHAGAGGDRDSWPGGRPGSGAGRLGWFDPDMVRLGRSLPRHPTPRNEDADVDVETPFVPDPRQVTRRWLIGNRPDSDRSSDSEIEVDN